MYIEYNIYVDIYVDIYVRYLVSQYHRSVHQVAVIFYQRLPIFSSLNTDVVSFTLPYIFQTRSQPGDCPPRLGALHPWKSTIFKKFKNLSILAPQVAKILLRTAQVSSV